MVAIATIITPIWLKKAYSKEPNETEKQNDLNLIHIG